MMGKRKREASPEAAASEDSDLDALPQLEEFKQRAEYKEEELKAKLEQLQSIFYARLDSAQLIKKEGKVPFVEHHSLQGTKPVEMPEADVHDDLKRELVFYNLTLEDAKRGV